MTAATSAKRALSRQEQLAEIVNVRAKTNQKANEQVAAGDPRFAEIAANPFFKVLFDESLSPEEKIEAGTKLLTFTGTREQNREVVAAFDLLREFLQSEREVMASKIVSMSDTENFATLKGIFEELNGALIDFENDMQPLTDIIDALHVLRANNQSLEAFREIQNEGKRAEARAAREREIDAEIAAVEAAIRQARLDAQEKKGDKTLFGFGGQSQEAIDRIAAARVSIDTNADKLAGLVNGRAAALAEFDGAGSNVDQAAKEKLRDMLNLSSDGHRERSQKLIGSALNFIETSKSKLTTVREELGHMNGQIRNLDDANGQMTMIYAILGESVKGAEKANKEIREGFLVAPEGETMVGKLSREQKERDINEHIAMLESSAVDTVATVADLTTASIRIKNMTDANQNQIQMARDMHSRGVAGVADRLSTVIQAVGAAAIAESNAMTAETLQAMANKTDVIAQKESMRIAMGVGDRAIAMQAAIEGLAQYGEVNKEAMEFTREGIEAMRANMAAMEQMSLEVAQSVHRSKGVIADVMSGTAAEEKAAAPAATVSSPFGLR